MPIRGPDRSDPPSPSRARTVDELTSELQLLRAWSGHSYRSLHREVVRRRSARGVKELPAFDTVHRCFQTGRTRIDVELVVDLAEVMLGDRRSVLPWRQACQEVMSWSTNASLVTVSSSLPADVEHFVGRRDELRILTKAVMHSPPDPVLVTGMAGVGKSALAVRVARSVSEQLHPRVTLAVDLRGYSEHQPPADPAAVLSGFLRALGASGSQIVHLSVTQRAARIRELLEGERAVVILDNAASDDQVEPLLLALRAHPVIVTSRHPMTRLATTARLDVLDPDDAIGLLMHAAGRTVSSGPEAARIAELVGYLPLAVSLVGARIRESSGWSMTDHAERLERASAAHELDPKVENAISLSYDGLADTQREMLLLVAQHPGVDIEPFAAAALADGDIPTTVQTLDTLRSAEFLQEPEPGRFTLHELVRSFAIHRARDEVPPSHLRAASSRLQNYYDAVLASAAPAHSPRADFLARPKVAAGSFHLPEVDRAEKSARWLEREWRNVASVALHADTPDEFVARAADWLHRYLDVTAHLEEAQSLHAAAARTSEGETRAHALTNLANVYIPLGRPTEAEAPLAEALSVYQELSDRKGQGRVLNNLGIVLLRAGRREEARDCFQRALELAQKGEPAESLLPLANLGRVSSMLGSPEDATEYFRQANRVADSLGDLVRKSQTLFGLGDHLRTLGHVDEGLRLLHHAVDLARECRFPYCEAYALNSIGLATLEVGDVNDAVAVQEEALDIARSHGFGMATIEILNDLGRSSLRAERPAEALEKHREALELARAAAESNLASSAQEGIELALEMLATLDTGT